MISIKKAKLRKGGGYAYVFTVPKAYVENGQLNEGQQYDITIEETKEEQDE